MDYKSTIFELDALINNVGFGVKNLLVIQTALAEGAVGPDDAGDALFVSYEFLHDLHDQMTMILNQAIKAEREHPALVEVVA